MCNTIAISISMGIIILVIIGIQMCIVVVIHCSNIAINILFMLNFWRGTRWDHRCLRITLEGCTIDITVRIVIGFLSPPAGLAHPLLPPHLVLMGLDVLGQVVGSREPLITSVALEPLVPRVSSLVPGELVRPGEVLVAAFVVTAVGLLVVVAPDVCLEVTGLVILLVATGNYAGVLFLNPFDAL